MFKRGLGNDRILPHPIVEAEANEVAEAVARATSDLPAPYREVIAFKLVHGLEPREIAHALGRPLETVRTQLKRGIAMLRKAIPKIDALLKRGSKNGAASAASPAAAAASGAEKANAGSDGPAAAAGFCAQCGKQLAAGAKFCAGCGAKANGQ